MDVIYRTNWIAKTRRRAAWVVFWYVLIISPSVVVALGRDLRPRELTARLALALAPILIARLCWRFLADAETRHPEPTEEMEFVFRLMTTVLIALGGVIVGVLAIV